MNSRILGLAAASFLALAAGVFGTHVYERWRSDTRADELVARHAAQSQALHRSAEQWADALAKAQGEAALRSFAAGLAPSLLAGRENAVEIAGTSMLRLSGVLGVTVLRPDGKALYASNAKLTVSDGGNEQTRWALTATDFITRAGTRSGTAEMALPVTDRGTVLAIVWLAYDVNATREQYRPEPTSEAPED